MVGVCEKQLGKDGRVLLITVLIVGHEERVQVWWEQIFVRLLLLHYLSVPTTLGAQVQ